MSYGLEIRDASNRLVFTTADPGGVYVERIQLAVGDSSNKVYNTDARLSGRALMVIQVGSGSHDWTTDTSGGYPRLNWTAKSHVSYPRVTTLLVFAQ